MTISFHVSCHIDSNIRQKIEQGEFVDLERLLPKDKLASGPNTFGQDMHKIELLMKDGQPYFGAASNENKINSIRRWDQAFRIYATIYTQVNPHRASEIWQYVHVIHMAASTYNWDNVAYYDYTFRQLMAVKPWHSWSNTYTQGWNLALRDAHIHKFNSGNFNPNTTFGHLGNNRRSNDKDWRDDCCWRYNKNHCNMSSNDCRYDHRCTYCGGWNHSFSNCQKEMEKRQ